MAICGIASTNGIRPRAEEINAMAFAMGKGVASTQQKGSNQSTIFGATSASSSTSLYSGDGLVVACDAELYCSKQQNSTSDGMKSDTLAALIAALYRRRGNEFLTEIDGIFSLALWDEQQDKLLLARDRLGVKSLCYAETSAALLFASYPGGVIASKLIERRVDTRSIVDYLNFNVVPAPRSAYKGIHKLKPGEYLTWQRGQIRRACYWELHYTENARGSEKQLAEELFSRLESSVQAASNDLNSKQVGCFLSGGTDSSSIAGLLTRIHQQPVHAFSIGFSEKRFDELGYAHVAARHFGLTHHEHILQPSEAYDIIPKIVDLFDEPFANASAIPTYACIELAKKYGVSVMLAGDGGDELFGGNERYRVHQLYDFYQHIPKSVRKIAEPVVFSLPSRVGLFNKANSYIRRSNIPNPERYCRWRLLQLFSSSEVLGDAMPSVNGDSLDAVRAHYHAASAKSELNRLLHIDMNMTLGDEDIPKVTRAAEGQDVNVRFPYLHYSLAEFSARLPIYFKVRGLKKRYLFKRATRELLPAKILNKKKHGFGLPVGIWLKTDRKLRAMARDVLLSPTTYQRGYFRKPFIEKLMSSLEQDNTPYYGDLLWVFLMLELWHRRHVAGTAL